MDGDGRRPAESRPLDRDGRLVRRPRLHHRIGRSVDFLTVNYGSDKTGGYQTLDRPLRTLTTLDRFGLIQWIKRKPTLRMLQVTELKRAVGLREDFRLEIGSRRDRIR